MSGNDRWAKVESPDAVATAAERLDQFSRIPSECVARERYLRLLAIGPGDRVLDLGAGTGDITLDIARRAAPGGAVTALDRSPGLLVIARQRAVRFGLSAQVETVAGDAHTLPWPAARFDRALSHWVLLHLSSPATVVAELRRVVRPGGRVVCVEVDWETMVVHPGDPGVTRQVVEANVERQLDGRMGRQLAPLFRGAGLNVIETLPIVALEANGGHRGWLDFLRTRIAVAANAGVSRRLLDLWWVDLQHAAVQGTFFFSVTQFAVAGTVPVMATSGTDTANHGCA